MSASERPQRADRRIRLDQRSRFDARTYAAQQAARCGRTIYPACSRCGSVAPLYRRPRPGCERTYPLADDQLEPALCGLCLDGIGGHR